MNASSDLRNSTIMTRSTRCLVNSAKKRTNEETDVDDENFRVENKLLKKENVSLSVTIEVMKLEMNKLKLKINKKADLLKEKLDSTTQQLTYSKEEMGQLQKKQEINPHNPANSDFLCIVCQENIKCILMQPCMHVCVCTKCSNGHLFSNCPICRESVDSLMKIYV